MSSTMAKNTILCFLSVTKMGIKTEGVRCKCTHGKRQQDENGKTKQRKAEVWHRGGVSKNKKINAEGLPSSTGEN